ncbi:MAG: hypothetical protein ALAOOOJD_04790 [bacterium]|nr:hypothetical protein [bacterium]
MLLHSSNFLSLRDGLQALFRRRNLILLIFALTVIPIGLATFTAENVYRATAKVLVRREDRPGALNPYFTRLNQEEDIRSELEIATSRPVLEKVLRRSSAEGQRLDPADLALSANDHGEASANEVRIEKALDRMRRHISVEAVTGANVIEIGFEDSHPQSAAWFANALASAYADYNAEVHGSEETENFLAERIKEAKGRLDSLETALYAYRTSTGLLTNNKQEDLFYEKYRTADQQLAQLREKAEVLDEKAQRLRKLRAAGDSLSIPTAEMDAHPSVRMLYSKITELRLERNALAEKYQPDHRLVADLNKQIKGVQAELIAEVDRLLVLENERLSSLRQEERVLARITASAKSEIQALPKKERVLNEIELAIDNARRIYSQLVIRREEMSVEKATDRRLSRITIISPAGVPFEPISPRKGRNMILAIVLGTMAGLAAGLVREFYDGTFKSPHEVTLALGVPVFGAVSVGARRPAEHRRNPRYGDEARQRPPAKTSEPFTPVDLKSSGAPKNSNGVI